MAGCRVHRYESSDELPFRLAAQHVAIGRLGKIFPALDTLSGRVITVECVPLTPRSSSGNDDGAAMPDDAAGDPFALIEQTLLAELLAQTGAIRSHRHILSYDALHCVASVHQVFLSASASPARLVSSLLRDFGSLHPLVVATYIRGVVSALSTLHEAGVVVGGISSSAILISSDGRALLASHFPSARTIEMLLSSTMLANGQIARCVLSRQNAGSGCAQDARSVAYVMAEMLTGMRMRGHLLEREHLLSHVASKSLESRFLSELLQSSALSSVASHPYMHEHSSDAAEPSLGAPAEQRAIAVLVEQELPKCREQRRRHVGEIRAWLAQFERRYDRKPAASERPRSVTQLQRRCRMLSERTKELETRLSSARRSFYRNSDAVERDESDELGMESHARLAENASPPSFISVDSSSVDSRLGTIGSLPAIDVSTRESELLLTEGGYKRSPAQNAFLKRLGPQGQQKQQESGTPAMQDRDESREYQQMQVSSSVVSDRANGHQLIHQRKEVMQVISSIAATTSVSNSPH